LGGEGGHREKDLVRGRVERPLPAVEVVDDADVGIEDLLDDVGRLDLLPPEPAFLTRDDYLERRPGPEHVQEAGQPRPLLKLGPTDPIGHKHVLIPHDPPAREGPRSRMLDLPGHRSLLIRDAGRATAMARWSSCLRLLAPYTRCGCGWWDSRRVQST